MKQLDLKEQIAQMKRVHARDLAELESRAQVCELANQLAATFAATFDGRVEVTTAVGVHTHNKTTIDVHLEEHHAIEVARPLLIAVGKTRLFKPPEEHNFLDLEWVGWEFCGREPGQKPLLVRVWFNQSKVCWLEPTGDVKPVMKVVCNKGDQ